MKLHYLFGYLSEKSYAPLNVNWSILDSIEFKKVVNATPKYLFSLSIKSVKYQSIR